MSSNIPQHLLEHFYRPFCSEDEIARIFDVQSADDYLLKTRADYVADHIRLYRIMRRRMTIVGDSWSFTEHFHRKEFDDYLGQLSDKDLQRCAGLSNGYVFSTDPNGVCADTPFGTVIMVSEALRYFLFYMSLAHFDHGIEVPVEVRMHAQMIAIRVMLESESLDFDLDPRGEFPDGLETTLSASVEASLEFVIGHEYSHHFLEHLDNSTLTNRALMYGELGGAAPPPHRIYSHKEQHEFDADIDAIARPECSTEYRLKLIYGAIVFFAFLDVYAAAKNQIAPVHASSKSHPDPIDRLWNVFRSFSETYEIDKSYVDGLLELLSVQKSYLSKNIAVNIDSYETYGSVYLADWRGPELVDRVDYYF